MVYESDFYTTRRPYRTTPSYSTYSSSKREIPWEKVPFVPRPSLIPDPVTAHGKKSSKQEAALPLRKKSVLDPSERAKIKPKVLVEPIKPYMSARDINREKIMIQLQRQETPTESMDVLLPRLHKVAELPTLPYKRRIVLNSDFY